jgi:protein TonB
MLPAGNNFMQRFSKPVRYGLAALLALVTTFGIFLGMQGLIDSGESAMTEGPQGRVIDFVRLQEDEQVREKDRKPEKPPKPEEQPPRPDMPKPSADNPMSTDSLDIGGVNIGADINIDAGIGAGAGEGDYLPIVKVAPVYPQRPMSRGIEGWVLVEFTVTTSGTVRDPQVVDADPPNVFNRAALDAAAKFKYKPRVVNGKPVEVAGVQNLIRFELER